MELKFDISVKSTDFNNSNPNHAFRLQNTPNAVRSQALENPLAGAISQRFGFFCTRGRPT